MGQAFRGCLTSLFHTSLLPMEPTDLGRGFIPFPTPPQHPLVPKLGPLDRIRIHKGPPRTPPFAVLVFGLLFVRFFCPKGSQKCPQNAPKCLLKSFLLQSSTSGTVLHPPDLKNHVFETLRTRIFIKFIQYLLVGFDVVLVGADIGPQPFRGRFLLQKAPFLKVVFGPKGPKKQCF